MKKTYTDLNPISNLKAWNSQNLSRLSEKKFLLQNNNKTVIDFAIIPMVNLKSLYNDVLWWHLTASDVDRWFFQLTVSYAQD